MIAVDVSYTKERRFVRVRIAAPATIDEICAAPPAILAECVARKRDLLLIDLTDVARGPISTLDRYRLGSSVIAFAGKLRKVAAVGQPKFIDPEKFGEQVARNRGVNVRVFSDLGEAQRWLLETD